MDPTSLAFIEKRPWICCQDVMLVGKRKSDGDPVYVACDRQVGHSGVHRGRTAQGTYRWRTLGAATVRKRRAARARREERAAFRQWCNEHPDPPHWVFSFGWLEWLASRVSA